MDTAKDLTLTKSVPRARDGYVFMDEDLAKTDKKIYRGHIRGGGVGCLALLANFVANHFL